jgi:periplasmic divalent cation tolerance protein
MEPMLVISNVPDRDTAVAIANALVEGRLAACVSILAPCTSIYRWNGTVETAEEIPIHVKTRSGLYAAVEAAIRERHPYELPEIIAVRLDDGYSGYIEWIAGETSNV